MGGIQHCVYPLAWKKLHNNYSLHALYLTFLILSVYNVQNNLQVGIPLRSNTLLVAQSLQGDKTNMILCAKHNVCTIPTLLTFETIRKVTFKKWFVFALMNSYFI